MDTRIRELERIARQNNTPQDWLAYAQATYRAGRDPRINPMPGDRVKLGLIWTVEELEGNIVVYSFGTYQPWRHIAEWREIAKRLVLVEPPRACRSSLDWIQQMEYFKQQQAI